MARPPWLAERTPWEMADGSKGAALWTDTWIRRNGKWQIVAAQDTPK
jgi:hypothetical protein